MEKFVLFNHASRAYWFFLYPHLLDVKNEVIVTYFFRGNPLLPHMLLFPITNKGSFIRTFPQTEQCKPQPLMDQLRTRGWDKKIAQSANASAVQYRSDNQNLHRWVLYCLNYVSFPPWSYPFTGGFVFAGEIQCEHCQCIWLCYILVICPHLQPLSLFVVVLLPSKI